jgi:hypothetical protein
MRSLRIALTAAAVAAVLWTASFADAAPGDYRLVTGTIVWPLVVVSERTLVIQGDDGVTHFAELAPVEPVTRLRAGDRVSMVAREGFQPNQLLFAQLERREDGNGGAPAALPTAVASAGTTPDIRESPDVVIGVVTAVRGRALEVTTLRGARVAIDVSAIDPDIRRDLRPGDQVTVYAPVRVQGQPVASGILVDHSTAPAALPRQP